MDFTSLGVYIRATFPKPLADSIILELLYGKDLEYISRTTLIGFAYRVFDTMVGEGKWNQSKVCERISWLYLYATAMSSDCDLFVSGFRLTSPLTYANLNLYLYTLSSVGITPE